MTIGNGASPVPEHKARVAAIPQIVGHERAGSLDGNRLLGRVWLYFGYS